MDVAASELKDVPALRLKSIRFVSGATPLPFDLPKR
jgi:hypothetical protein